MTTNYQEYLDKKRELQPPSGITVGLDEISPMLYPFQREIVRWALARGRAALFEDCGLGKTPQQLEWARASFTSIPGETYSFWLHWQSQHRQCERARSSISLSRSVQAMPMCNQASISQTMRGFTTSHQIALAGSCSMSQAFSSHSMG